MISLEMIFEELTPQQRDIYNSVEQARKNNPGGTKFNIAIPAGVDPQDYLRDVQKVYRYIASSIQLVQDVSSR